MVRSWVPAVLLIAGLALITSLYLPWQRATCGAVDYFQSGPPTAGLSNLSSGGCTSFDGWSTGIGAAAALFAVLSVAVGAAALARPNSFGAALGQCALSAGYFGLAIAVRAPLDARQESRVLHQPFHYAYGTYLGIAAAAVLLLFAWVTPLRDHVRFAPANLLAFVLAVGLLVAFLLPWAQFNRTTEPGLLLAPGLAGAALASLVPLVFWRPELPALGAAVALVTAGAVSYLVFPAARAYGAWLALGLAGALALLALIVGRPSSLHLPLPALPTLLLASVFLVSLFLPWQRTCFDRNESFGAFSGRCFAANAWTYTAASAAALLVLGLALLALVPSTFVSSAEVAAALALLVATVGFTLVDRNELGQRLSFGYGAFVDFAASAALVAVVLLPLRPAIGRPRLFDCAAPVLACSGYVSILLLPSWRVLSDDADRALRFGPFSWLTVAGVLLAVHLLGRWGRRLRGFALRDPLLVVLPLGLLALTTLDLIEGRDRGLTWGGGVVVGLCLALVVLGQAEQQGGIRSIRVPELLRVDRI